MRDVLVRKRDSIRTILVSCDRLPGYSTLKLGRVLPQLGRAIQKVREGTYGFCDDCDEKIPEERLEAVAGATRCIACQTLKEKKMHH